MQLHSGLAEPQCKKVVWHSPYLPYHLCYPYAAIIAWTTVLIPLSLEVSSQLLEPQRTSAVPPTIRNIIYLQSHTTHCAHTSHHSPSLSVAAEPQLAPFLLYPLNQSPAVRSNYSHNTHNSTHTYTQHNTQTRLTFCLISCSLLIVSSALINSASFLASCCWTATLSLSLDCSCSSGSQQLKFKKCTLFLHGVSFLSFTFSLSCC